MEPIIFICKPKVRNQFAYNIVYLHNCVLLRLLGAFGLVMWNIHGTGKNLAVLYSIPYTHKFGVKNWLAIGIFPESERPNVKLLRSMYEDKKTENFKRKAFSSDNVPIKAKIGHFEVYGTMDTTYDCKITIAIRPTSEENYAAVFRGETVESINEKVTYVICRNMIWSHVKMDFFFIFCYFVFQWRKAQSEAISQTPN